ncbi:GAF domain-containing SpoIIE family protein phosphatase [Streptomyces sp. TRM70308]|uniref:PP2C family protein-serine/threonine phosphatase n=1 Tax=Streptomyces sp. TRM70308 TaxID=3131932 RepID=UPI003D027963
MRQQAPAAGDARRVPRPAPPPEDAEGARMAAVRRYGLLDTPPEGVFDRLAALAARLLDAPVATVSVVDADRVRYKAACGLGDLTHVDREPGLCASAVLQDAPLVVPDARADPVARHHPLVTGPPGVRFYAAAPLVTEDGHRLGTVSVMDTRPRHPTEADTATLVDLAGIAMDALRLRLSAVQTTRRARHRVAAEQEQTAVQERRAATERAAREQAEEDKAALASFASALQRTLLPPALPGVPGLELACHYHAASTDRVGGDFYDVFPLADGRWAFFLGDVCGKGVEAAAVTSLTRHTLRAAAHFDPGPRVVLTSLNTALLTDVSAGSRFCTAVFGTLAPRSGGGFTVSVATGGHPPTYRLLPTAPGDAAPVRVEEVPLSGGMLVGAFPSAHFAETTFDLLPGQALLLYTDGLTEARTRDQAMLGEEGLVAFLARRTGAQRASALIEDTTALVDSLPDGAQDDVALLALSVPTVPTTTADVVATTHATPAPHPDGPEH